MKNYKEVFVNELTNLRQFLKQNVNRDEAIESWEYFNKYLQLLNIYQEARMQCPLDGLEMACGDYNSPIMIILPSFSSASSQLFIGKVRDYLTSISNEKRTYRFSEVCLVSYGKGTMDVDIIQLLGYEIGIIKPKVILSLVKMNVPGVDVRYFDLTPETIDDEESIQKFLSVIQEELPTENKKAS